MKTGPLRFYRRRGSLCQKMSGLVLWQAEQLDNSLENKKLQALSICHVYFGEHAKFTVHSPQRIRRQKCLPSFGLRRGEGSRAVSSSKKGRQGHGNTKVTLAVLSVYLGKFRLPFSLSEVPNESAQQQQGCVSRPGHPHLF